MLNRRWKQGDVVELVTELSVKPLEADPRVKEDEGQRAIQRGPLIYCAEQIDNAENFQDIAISAQTKWQEQPVGILGGITELVGQQDEQTVTLIPYYAWDNREACEMRVWLPWK